MKSLFFGLLPLMVLVLSASGERMYKSSAKKMLVIVNEKSPVLAAGTRYEAGVFLYSVPENLPTMTFEGRQINVDENGVGGLSFIATGGVYDREGNVKKKFKGSVKLKMDGKDTVFYFMKEYMVQKPSIEISGRVTRTLFKNCGNEIQVDVPDLGSTYNPSFRAFGAIVIPGAKKGYVTIIPTGSKVTLNISSSGNLVGKEDFAVQEVAAPEVAVYMDTLPVDLVMGMPLSELGPIQLKLTPDQFFMYNFPKDARFRIIEAKASLMRLNNLIDTLSFNQGKADLSFFKNKAQKGDRIVIEIVSLKRTNFMNKVEEMEPYRPFSIPLY